MDVIHKKFDFIFEEKGKKEFAQLCLILCSPIDCSPPGSSVHGIFQGRI